MLDLMIVMESSSSVRKEEFDYMTKFLSGLVSRFNVKPDAVKVNFAYLPTELMC